jgi:multicomponent K+:H+ antiporter subunit E
MKRLLPAPLLSSMLLVLWLALNQTVAPGHLLLAAVLAVAVPIVCAPLRPLRVRVRRPGIALGLCAVVARDVIVSNLEIARAMLSARRALPRSAFVRIPLDLRDANGLAALAVITTIVPGTVWCELALDGSALLLHVFDVDDEPAFVAHYKARYERPLMEIFE